MRTKQVLILASVASMIDQFNMQNIKILKEMGYKVHVACNFTEGNTCSDEQIYALRIKLSELGVKFYQIDFKRNIIDLPQNILAFKQVHRLVNKNKYEFIHCHSPIGGVCGRLVAKKTKTKVIYTAHGFHFFKGAPFINWLIYYPIERMLARYTDVLITINKEDFNRAKKFMSKNVEYIPGVGIDIGRINNVEVDIKAKRQELGVPEDSLILLSVGELNKNKNHKVVIKALAKLGNKKIHYLICGQGRLKEFLGDISKELGVEKQVHLLGFRNDIPEICKMSDVFVLPSFREGLSVALMEAMACGMPVVCSDIRGNSDLIENGNGGYLVKPGDIKGFEKVIGMLSVDVELRNKLAKFNREKIKMYSIENINSYTKKIMFNK